MSKTSRDLRQEQSVSKWIKAKGKGVIVGATGYGFNDFKKFNII